MSAQPRSGWRVLSIADGSARVAWVALLAALFAVGAWIAWPEETGPEAEAAARGVSSVDEGQPVGPRDDEQPVRTAQAQHGRIHGAVNVPPGVPFPERWELHVRPARYYDAGGATERTLVFEAGESEFEVEELPLGHYEVLPVAEGLNAHAQPVVLTAESSWVYVSTLMTPAGTLSGQLLHESGTGVDGLTIRLIDRRSEFERVVETDLAGVFRFERLPDGEYRLEYGEVVNPLREPRTISFRAPSMHLPAEHVESSGQVTIQVLDSGGNPVEGVVLTGSGSGGGTIDRVTNADGTSRIAGLPAGDYRIWCTHPERGERELEVFTLHSGDHATVQFVLEP